jgi:hypothetical protein
MVLAGGIALPVCRLLALLDVVVNQPTDEIGTRRRAQAGIAADGAQ